MAPSTLSIAAVFLPVRPTRFMRRYCSSSALMPSTLATTRPAHKNPAPRRTSTRLFPIARIMRRSENFRHRIPATTPRVESPSPRPRVVRNARRVLATRIPRARRRSTPPTTSRTTMMSRRTHEAFATPSRASSSPTPPRASSTPRASSSSSRARVAPSRRRALTPSSSSRAPVDSTRLDSTYRVRKQCARGFHPIPARPTPSSRRVVIGQ